jgi:hypothetical protein
MEKISCSFCGHKQKIKSSSMKCSVCNKRGFELDDKLNIKPDVVTGENLNDDRVTHEIVNNPE